MEFSICTLYTKHLFCIHTSKIELSKVGHSTWYEDGCIAKFKKLQSGNPINTQAIWLPFLHERAASSCVVNILHMHAHYVPPQPKHKMLRHVLDSDTCVLSRLGVTTVQHWIQTSMAPINVAMPAFFFSLIQDIRHWIWSTNAQVYNWSHGNVKLWMLLLHIATNINS